MLYRRPPVGYRRTSSEAEPETMINLAQQHVFNPGYGVDRNYWTGHFVR